MFWGAGPKSIPTCHAASLSIFMATASSSRPIVLMSWILYPARSSRTMLCALRCALRHNTLLDPYHTVLFNFYMPVKIVSKPSPCARISLQMSGMGLIVVSALCIHYRNCCIKMSNIILRYQHILTQPISKTWQPPNDNHVFTRKTRNNELICMVGHDDGGVSCTKAA